MPIDVNVCDQSYTIATWEMPTRTGTAAEWLHDRKFIMGVRRRGQSVMLIFPRDIAHISMRNRFSGLASAGFIRNIDGVLECHGFSESIQLSESEHGISVQPKPTPARPIDSEVVRAYAAALG